MFNKEAHKKFWNFVTPKWSEATQGCLLVTLMWEAIGFVIIASMWMDEGGTVVDIIKEILTWTSFPIMLFSIVGIGMIVDMKIQKYKNWLKQN